MRFSQVLEKQVLSEKRVLQNQSCGSENDRCMRGVKRSSEMVIFCERALQPAVRSLYVSV